MSQARWTTWWCRAQRGLGLVPWVSQQCVEVTLPVCSKIRIRFASYYDTSDAVLDNVVLTTPHQRKSITFSCSSHCYLSANTSICSDEIELPPNTHQVTLTYQLHASRTNSGITLTMEDEVTSSSTHVFALQGIDVYTTQYIGCVVAFGDSITEQGHWTRVLRRDLEKLGYRLLNLGISGNRLLRQLETVYLNGELGEGTQVPLEKQVFGLSGIQRFYRDVFSNTPISLIIMALGINDLYQPGSFCASIQELPTLKELQEGYETLCAIAKQQQTPMVAQCMTPFAHCEHDTIEKEHIRSLWNQWLCSFRMHACAISFDHILMGEHQELKQCYHDGDHLHPNPLGGEQMANIIKERLEELECLL